MTGRARSFGIVLTFFLAVGLGRAEARVLVHVARSGETPEQLAALYYGNRSLATFILEANGLRRPGRLVAGQRVRVPTAFRYRMQRGETLEAVAARFLDDPRRAPFIAGWSGLARGERGREGLELLLPFQFVHRARAPESLASVAKAFYDDPGQARMLLGYNFRSSPVLATGERLVVPIVHVRVRSVHLSRTPALRGRAKPVEEAPRPDADRREAELAARVAQRLDRSERAYREGNYSEVPAALTKLLSEEDPSERQLVAIHRLLGFAYVALGAEEVAVNQFREVLERDPEARLDEVMVSPKIRAAFERARKRP